MDNDWSFLKKPFWIFSHVFVIGAVVTCGYLSSWQFTRLEQRKDQNQLIEQRSTDEPQDMFEIVDQPDSDFSFVQVDVRIVDPDFIRIGNRSFDGIAGEYVVAIAETDEKKLFINRGFVPLSIETQDLGEIETNGAITIAGWLRNSVKPEKLAVEDIGDDKIAPRFDTQELAKRLSTDSQSTDSQSTDSEIANSESAVGETYFSDYFQLASIEGVQPTGMPSLVALPELTEGNHFSYAWQWIIFGSLAAIFYVAILLRKAKGSYRTAQAQ